MQYDDVTSIYTCTCSLDSIESENQNITRKLKNKFESALKICLFGYYLNR